MEAADRKTEEWIEQEMQGFCGWMYELEISKNTIRTYRRYMLEYFQMYGEITKSNLIEYKKYALERCKPATAAIRCCAVNKYCMYIDRPDCKVKAIRPPRRARLENIPTMEEYQQMLYWTEKDENWKTHFIVKFLAKTGARANEFVRFEKEHLKKGEVELWTKGKVRRVIIPRDLIRESMWYFDTFDNKYLFPNRYGNQMTVRGLAGKIKKLGKYGFREEILHPHAFRHFFAIHFLENNPNITLLADLLGHSGLATTQVYLTLSAQEQRDQLNAAMDGW